jgi:hypothetical protein
VAVQCSGQKWRQREAPTNSQWKHNERAGEDSGYHMTLCIRVWICDLATGAHEDIFIYIQNATAHPHGHLKGDEE